MAHRQTTTSTSGASPTSMDLAVPVSERVEIIEVRLAESMTKRGKLRDSLPANLSMRVNAETELELEQKVVCVRPYFVLTAKYDEADEDLMRVEARFVLRYHLPSIEGLSKANFDAFGQLNGIYNAWPYWREFVQSTLARMGLPPLILPVYRPLQAASQTSKAAGIKKNGESSGPGVE